ncbi:hypothetical protein Pen01_29500 [Phytomonospora endophytica]|nr:hypothetical protein Pen01_29500 [Phytomonospora endophytica]
MAVSAAIAGVAVRATVIPATSARDVPAVTIFFNIGGSFDDAAVAALESQPENPISVCAGYSVGREGLPTCARMNRRGPMVKGEVKRSLKMNVAAAKRIEDSAVTE